ncbi:D-Ala-D-Ala carboxypeptidase family metallohydrolase [Eubacterium sp. 1001713B170207_170306_E7]|uniref:YcbK family protein n=1 Tax=Eubacterium sp. 1001713B170207_170306_E7 TaxID=2787097 RepID=UPI00189C1DF0|nr:D-Ala-D-Ala carboxypeptidase family metallohydrolase [Eubacterium sp. 1001713B170207_170306_E7]
MRKFYRRIFITLTAVLVVVTSGVFFTSFQAGPPEPPVLQPPPVTAPGPEVSEPEPAPETETPPDGSVIEHPLPEDPIHTDGPWASAHFLMDEYACDCAGYCDGWPAQMDPELLEKVEALRCVFDRPIIITSGVRCIERNTEVGGIENSWHLSGHAADLYCPGVPYDEVAGAARALGLGVIEYPDRQFDHVEIWS